MQKTIISKNINETHSLASSMITNTDQNIFFLYGDLGSGKTTFAQGVGRALQITHHLQSPTFIIMRKYELKHTQWDVLYHVDLYRIESVHELEELGILDLMNDRRNLFLIEWPEKLSHFIPPKRIEIHFTYVDEDRRKIQIEEV